MLSFAFVAIYWHNHHHLLHPARRVTGGVMWANTHLLLWLLLLPFATGRMGAAYVLLTLMWLVPDPRIAHALEPGAPQ